MVPICWPRWPPCQYMLKPFKNPFSPEPRNWEPWNLVWSFENLKPPKFVQRMIWGWNFCIKVKLTSLCMHMGKKVKRQFFKNYWSLISHIWHTYFINKEHENIWMSRSTDDLWPSSQGHMDSHFKWLLCRRPWASCNQISYLASYKKF